MLSPAVDRKRSRTCNSRRANARWSISFSEGSSNKKIAAQLHISPHTVKSHVRNIMEKLTLHTRLEIAAWVHTDEPE